MTIDADGPTSEVVALSGIATNANFTVCWQGSDLGSGVAGYDVYVSVNGGPWTLWLENTPLNCETFNGLNDMVYSFYSVARDGAGHVEVPTPGADTSTVTLPNYPPVIDPVPPQYVLVGQQLVITNTAHDPDTPIIFSLGGNAPAGAGVTTNGVFTWTPACAQGSTTNDIVIVATDSGGPAMSSSNVLTVIVYECIEASLGRTEMQAGTTSSVPIYLLSTVELTNLSFTVVYPPDRFTNLMVLADTNVVPEPFTTNLNDHQFLVSFALSEEEVLYGPTNVGELSLEALAGQSSAFVPLEITEVTGRKPDGGIVGTWYGYPGRVVVIGPEPLLEAVLNSNREPALIVYGTPGTTNQLQSRTTLDLFSNWADGWLPVVVPTNGLWQVVDPLELTNAIQFIRARRE